MDRLNCRRSAGGRAHGASGQDWLARRCDKGAIRLLQGDFEGRRRQEVRRRGRERLRAQAQSARSIAVSPCCSTYGEAAGAHFDERIARHDLETYRKKGSGVTTRLLRDLLLSTGPIDGVLLDVGSGIGALTFELLKYGVTRAIAVDASSAYLAAAAEEAVRGGHGGSVQFVQSDFLAVASQVPAATVVTLDRVICCYPWYEPLLEESLRHAERYIAFSYPRNVWYVRSAIAFENAVRRLQKDPFRAFVHSVERMEEVLQRGGFGLAARRQSWQWAADVWVRSRG